MQSFNWQLQLVPEGMEHTSILASIASPFAVLLIPLGFGAWQLAVQIMQSFNWQLQLVPEGMEHTSILASIASPFAVLLIPLGFGAWQLAAAAITGFIAKENVVGTIAVVYGLTNFINVDDLVLTGGANTVATTMGLTSVAALAYLMFNLYTPPCFAAIGAMNSEIKDKKWLLGGVGLQFAAGYTVAFLVYQIGTLITTPPCFAAIGAMNSEIKDKKWLLGGVGLQFAAGYTVAFLVYQIGTLITTGSVGQGFLPGLVVVLAIAAFIIRLIVKENKRFDEEYSLGGSVGQGFLPGLVVVLAIAAFIIRLIVKENKRFDEEYSLGNKSIA